MKEEKRATRRLIGAHIALCLVEAGLFWYRQQAAAAAPTIQGQSLYAMIFVAVLTGLEWLFWFFVRFDYWRLLQAAWIRHACYAGAFFALAAYPPPTGQYSANIATVFLILAVVQGIRSRNQARALVAPPPQRRYTYLDLVPDAFMLGYHGRYDVVSMKEQKLEQHLLLLGPTGEGKSSRFIIPCLLRERGHRSVFVLDPKGELYQTTGGALAQYGPVWLFDPTSPASKGYNPLVYVTTLEDAQEIAACWITNTGRSREEFWNITAEQVITASIMHLKTVDAHAPFSSLADLLSMPFQQLAATLDSSPSDMARTIARPLLYNLSADPKLAAGVLAGVVNRFLLLQDPQLRQVTARAEIDFKSMGQHMTALYFAIAPDQAERLRPLSSLFMLQMFKAWMQQRRLAQGVTCYLDEFANVGRIPKFEEYIATVRSVRVALILAIQDFGQLDRVYGRASRSTILSNARTHLVMPGCGLEECEHYSARIGDTIIHLRSEQEQTGLSFASELGFMFGTQSGYSEAIRRAIPPEEIRTLQRGMLLVLSGSQASFQVFTLPYYEDDDIATRAHIPIAQPQPQRPYQAGYQAQGGQQQVDPR